MKKILLYLIKFYQKNISPYKGTKCPYFPSCSAYGKEAIETHGVIIGSVLQHGEYFVVILFQREGMIRFLKK